MAYKLPLLPASGPPATEEMKMMHASPAALVLLVPSAEPLSALPSDVAAAAAVVDWGPEAAAPAASRGCISWHSAYVASRLVPTIRS